jgi:hypothetical protein
MINKPILMLWIVTKIDSLKNRIDLGYFDSPEEEYRSEGELRVLKQLYDEFNLESINKEDLEYHNNI